MSQTKHGNDHLSPPAALQALLGLLVNSSIEYDEEEDGRVIAEVEAPPGCLVYGANRDEASGRVQALALRVLSTNLAAKLEHGE